MWRDTECSVFLRSTSIFWDQHYKAASFNIKFVYNISPPLVAKGVTGTFFLDSVILNHLDSGFLREPLMSEILHKLKVKIKKSLRWEIQIG